MRVQLFITCLIDSLFPDVGEACYSVLRQAGCSVEFVQSQTCCGQPAHNAGYAQNARTIAGHLLSVYQDSSEPIIIPSGSCAHMLRHGYTDLLPHDPNAAKLSTRVFELSQFLVDTLAFSPAFHPQPVTVAYHPSCHLLRGMGIDNQPKSLLRQAGHKVIDLAPDCCGFGGVFSIDHPELSGEMLTRKLEAIQESGAQYVTAADVSCLMNIEGGLRRIGSTIRCVHFAQLLVPNTQLVLA